MMYSHRNNSKRCYYVKGEADQYLQQNPIFGHICLYLTGENFRRIHNKELKVVVAGVGMGRVGLWIKGQVFSLLYSHCHTNRLFHKFASFYIQHFPREKNPIQGCLFQFETKVLLLQTKNKPYYKTSPKSNRSRSQTGFSPFLLTNVSRKGTFPSPSLPISTQECEGVVIIYLPLVGRYVDLQLESAEQLGRTRRGLKENKMRMAKRSFRAWQYSYSMQIVQLKAARPQGKVCEPENHAFIWIRNTPSTTIHNHPLCLLIFSMKEITFQPVFLVSFCQSHHYPVLTSTEK